MHKGVLTDTTVNVKEGNIMLCYMVNRYSVFFNLPSDIPTSAGIQSKATDEQRK